MSFDRPRVLDDVVKHEGETVFGIRPDQRRQADDAAKFLEFAGLTHVPESAVLVDLTPELLEAIRNITASYHNQNVSRLSDDWSLLRSAMDLASKHAPLGEIYLYRPVLDTPTVARLCTRDTASDPVDQSARQEEP